MAGSSPPGTDDRDRVLDASDIVPIVGECVTLRPKGREFVGLCPFHDDHSPSMYVSPQKQIFKCFACGAGGNVFDFVIRYHRMEFKEALSLLAERAGIELRPSRSANDDDASSPGPTGAEIIEAHRIALRFYRAILRHEAHGDVAREQFADRGFDSSTLERFELGAAPDRWDGLATTLESKSIAPQPFIAAGLIQPRKSGSGYVDRFRNRLIFPIHDISGRPIAFGARRIKPDDDPKYLNSPEHPRFSKTRTLYGLHLAKAAIQSSSTAILVEGYTDVIALAQAGVQNVVATLGTSLTREHAAALRRLCDRVVLVFDGDAAGQRAADRAVEIFFQSEIDVQIAILPGGADPAEFVGKPDGAEQFRAVTGNATEALDFLLASLRGELARAEGVSGRQRLIEVFGERLGRLGFHQMTPLRRDLALAKLSGLVGAPVSTLVRHIPRPRPPRAEAAPRLESTSATEEPVSQHPGARLDAERGLLGCLLHSPRLLAHLDEAGRPLEETIRPNWFAAPDHRRILESLVESPEDQRDLSRLPVLGETDALSKLATDLFWRIRRESGGREEQVRELFMAYLDAMREWAQGDPETQSDMECRSTDIEGGRVESMARLEMTVRRTRDRGGNRRQLVRPSDPGAFRAEADSGEQRSSEADSGADDNAQPKGISSGA